MSDVAEHPACRSRRAGGAAHEHRDFARITGGSGSYARRAAPGRRSARLRLGVGQCGRGKTKVLTDRVVRLLLSGAQPGRILCLTFTKAAAANMAIRVFERPRSLGHPRRREPDRGTHRTRRAAARAASRSGWRGGCSRGRSKRRAA